MSLYKQAWKVVQMTRRVGGVKAAAKLVREGPKQITLFRNLFMDPRVPAAPKVVFLGAIGYAVSPLNFIPWWVPILGPLDDLGIALLAGSFFVKQIPRDLLAEHRHKVGLKDNFGAA
jgi:uncharacterized membrane protein YkvA (DUF1232 family)